MEEEKVRKVKAKLEKAARKKITTKEMEAQKKSKAEEERIATIEEEIMSVMDINEDNVQLARVEEKEKAAKSKAQSKAVTKKKATEAADVNRQEAGVRESTADQGDHDEGGGQQV